MIVRPATLSDLPRILRIYNHAVLNLTATADYEPQTLETRTSWYEDRVSRGFAVLVAEEEGETVGWGALNPYHVRIGYRFTAENSVYVSHEHLRKGIGRAILTRLITEGRTQGLKTILALIDADNRASIDLHASLGYEQAGYLKRVFTKFDRWLDVVLMQITLEP